MKFSFHKPKRSTPDLREPFVLAHRGGEIWTVNIDSLGDDIDLIKTKILHNEVLMNRASMTAFVLYHLHDTDVTYEVASYMIESLMRSKDFLRKLALVGTTSEGKKNIERYIKNAKVQWLVPSRFFSSLDEAKDWLVGVE